MPVTERPMTLRSLPLLLLLGCPASDDADTDDTDVEDTDTDDSDDTDGGDTDDSDTDDSDSDTDDSDTDTDDSDTDTDTDLPPDPCLADPSTMVLGTGEEAFQTVATNADLELVLGPQGGWHLDVSLQAENVLQLMTMAFTVTDVDTQQVLHDIPINAFMTPTTGSSWQCDGEYLAYRATIDNPLTVDGTTGTPPEVLCGRLVEIEATLKIPPNFMPADYAGTVLTQASFVARVQPDADDDGLPPCYP